FEILAKREESGEPAPAKSVDVGAVTDQKFHHRNAAGLCDTLKRHIVYQDLTQFGVGCQKFSDKHEIVGVDGLFQLTGHFEAIDVVLEFGPAWETILASDLELGVGKSGGDAGTKQIFGLVAKMTEIGTFGKLHGEILSIARCPRVRAKGVSH